MSAIKPLSTITITKRVDVEIEAVEALLPFGAQLLEHLAETLDAFAVAIVDAVLQHAPKRSVEIAVVEQIVGQLLHDVGRIELEAPLRAVPG